MKKGHGHSGSALFVYFRNLLIVPGEAENSFVQDGDGADGGAGALTDLQRQRNKSETLAHQQIQVAQVLHMCNPALATRHVAWVGFIQEHIRARVVHAEVDRPLVDDELRGVFGQAGLVAGVFRII